MARTLALQRDVNNHIGEIQLEIDHCLEFVKMHEGFRRHSQTVLIRGLPWKIFASLKQRENRPRTLGFFLECDGVESNPRWYSLLRPFYDFIRKRRVLPIIKNEQHIPLTLMKIIGVLQNLSIAKLGVANETTSSPTHVQIANSMQHSMDQLKGEIEILVDKNAKLKFELEEIHDENTCLICYDRQRDILILPCSHLACCNACAPGVLRLNQCCVCRTKIGGFLKIYKS